MSDNLYEANYQWANRPDDQRFTSLEQMYSICKGYADNARTATVAVKDLSVEAEGTNLRLAGKTGASALLTHYSFGQLSRLAGAPSDYLRGLSPALATANLREGLQKQDKDKKLCLLFHQNGDLVTRSVTTQSYDRVWNHEVVERVVRAEMIKRGWQVPPARPAREGQAGTRKATKADLLPNQGDFGLRIKEGDLIAPAGLYASDHDCFIFLVNQVEPIWDGQKFLHRGVFVKNSEVGDGSLTLVFFLYDNVCGNHIVWGVSEVTTVSVRHVKGKRQHTGNTLNNARSKWRVMASQKNDIKQLESAIAKAREFEIAATKDEVIDAVFAFGKKKSLQALTKANLLSAYEAAEKTPRYGAPTTVWGLVNGLTEVSQSTHTDTRTDLDVAAGRVMEMAF